MAEQVQYQYLRRKRGSVCQQLYVEGRIRAEVIYRETIGIEPLTPQEVAREYNVPVEAVHEAIEYCTCNKELLDAERAIEAASIKTHGLDRWPYAPKDYRPDA
jgi:hypothetical protein